MRCWLTENASTASPGQIIVVHTAVRREPVDSVGCVEREVMVCGHMRYARLKGGTPCKVHGGHFESVELFHKALQARLNPRRPLWLWGYLISRQIRQLGFLERIERCEYYLYAQHSKTPDLPLLGERVPLSDGLWCDADPPTIVILRHESGAKLIILDVLNWYNKPIAEIAASLGATLPELPPEPGLDSALPDCCEIVSGIVFDAVASIITFVRDHDLGKMRLTAAGQALAAYRHRLGPKGAPIVNYETSHGELRRRERRYLLPEPYECEEVQKLEAKAHYGGQVECWFVGSPGRTIYQVDVNGLYPSVMHRYEYPCRLDCWQIPVDGFGLQEPEPGKCKVAHVLVETDCETLPVRTKSGTVYARGRFDTYLAGAELRVAVEFGLVERWYGYAAYDTYPLFREFVEWGWSARLSALHKGDGCTAALCKSLLVAMYGKWIQRLPEWTPDHSHCPPAPWQKYQYHDAASGEWVPARSIGWNQELAREQRYAPHACVAIASCIAAAARARMVYFRDIAGHYHTYYQCVDTLFVDDDGLAALDGEGLLSDTELGKLRICGQDNLALFRGRQSFVFAGRNVQGPLQRTSVHTRETGWSKEEWERLSSVCNRQPDGSVRVRHGSLEHRATPQTGYVTPSGWVIPYLIGTHGTVTDSPLPPDSDSAQAADSTSAT